jgi:DNA-binding transcriptional ArsR family regulator
LDVPELNAVGDLVLTDPGALRALADPVRLELHDRLRRHGPATAAELAAHVDATEQAVEEHLRELEAFGLVTPGDRWAAVGRGFVFEIPDEPEGQAAARELSRVMLLQYVDLPRDWAAEDEPRLGLEWARAAGMLNAGVTVTPDELRGLQEELERLLEPFLSREPAEAPPEAGRVRILGYFLPKALHSSDE